MTEQHEPRPGESYCYFKGNIRRCGIASVRLESEAVDTAGRADALLDELTELPGVEGGHVEQHVPGIGWVNADDADNALHGLHRMLADGVDG